MKYFDWMIVALLLVSQLLSSVVKHMVICVRKCEMIGDGTYNCDAAQ